MKKKNKFLKIGGLICLVVLFSFFYATYTLDIQRRYIESRYSEQLFRMVESVRNPKVNYHYYPNCNGCIKEREQKVQDPTSNHNVTVFSSSEIIRASVFVDSTKDKIIVFDITNYDFSSVQAFPFERIFQIFSTARHQKPLVTNLWIDSTSKERVHCFLYQAIVLDKRGNEMPLELLIDVNKLKKLDPQAPF